MKASDIKRNMAVMLEGAPHVVEDVVRQTPSARGAATLFKIRFRNLITRQKRDATLHGDDNLTEAAMDKRECQFMFRDDDRYTFMDMDDYNQFPLSVDDLDGQQDYLVEDMEGITALMIDERVVAIELPAVVEMAIAVCDPAMRGASATARTKPANLVTGRVVQVPEYLAPGDVIRVDTRTGKYLSRA